MAITDTDLTPAPDPRTAPALATAAGRPVRVADRVFRWLAFARGPARARHPRADRDLDDEQGLARGSATEGVSTRLHATTGIPRQGSLRRRWRCSYGTLLVAVHRADPRGAGQHRHRAVRHRGRARGGCAGPSSTRSTCSPRSRRSSSACGGCCVLAPDARRASTSDLGDDRRRHPDPRDPLRGDPIARAELHDRRAHPRDHDHPDHHRRSPVRSSRPCPPAQKEAALALGATRWEMIRGAVFPHSRSGIVAASLIGLGRAMGETIAVALVIGSSPQITAKTLQLGRHDGRGDRQPVR